MNYTTTDNYVQWASSKSNYDAVVLAAGDFPVHTIPLGILHSAKNSSVAIVPDGLLSRKDYIPKL